MRCIQISQLIDVFYGYHGNHSKESKNKKKLRVEALQIQKVLSSVRESDVWTDPNKNNRHAVLFIALAVYISDMDQFNE